MNDTETFFYNVYAIMDEIPKGKVATYGQLARLAGYERRSRLVGRALRYADQYGDYPCHRVVGHGGKLAIGFDEQHDLLMNEGVTFISNGTVDMKKYQWNQ